MFCTSLRLVCSVGLLVSAIASHQVLAVDKPNQGCHSDVSEQNYLASVLYSFPTQIGGGYKEHDLSHIALLWMAVS